MDSYAHHSPVIAQVARSNRGEAKFPRVLILALSAFSALSCIAGGLALVIGYDGNRFLPPLDLLRFNRLRAMARASPPRAASLALSGWSTVAWLLAFPFSFAPGPFVDESTPFVPQLTFWTIGGLVMAVVMALVTWRGVRTLTRDAAASR